MDLNGLSHCFAFILYRPGRKGAAREQISYSATVMPILFPLPLKEEAPSILEIASLCSKWRQILDRRQDELNENGATGGPGAGYIDILKSWRRRYAVRGVLLSDRPGASPREDKSYLFTLERLTSEALILKAVFREWNLSPREQEIVCLILKDFGNKEISKEIGISINTIKGYIKLLTRKVGVHTRAGVVSVLLTGKKKGETQEASSNTHAERIP
jgi:DNA-binding CsgD family transcriptional regulator